MKCKKCSVDMIREGISEGVNRQEWDNYYWDGERMYIGDTVSGDSEVTGVECRQCGHSLTEKQQEEFEELY